MKTRLESLKQNLDLSKMILGSIVALETLVFFFRGLSLASKKGCICVGVRVFVTRWHRFIISNLDLKGPRVPRGSGKCLVEITTTNGREELGPSSARDH